MIDGLRGATSLEFCRRLLNRRDIKVFTNILTVCEGKRFLRSSGVDILNARWGVESGITTENKIWIRVDYCKEDFNTASEGSLSDDYIKRKVCSLCVISSFLWYSNKTRTSSKWSKHCHSVKFKQANNKAYYVISEYTGCPE